MKILKLKKSFWCWLTLAGIFISGLYHFTDPRWQDNNWKALIGSDGLGYYAYLPKTWIYKSSDYSFLDSLGSRYTGLKYGGHGFTNTFNGKEVNKYYAGESVALLPFFGVAHALSGDRAHPRDGFSFYYVAAAGIAALCYLLLGLACITLLLRRCGIGDFPAAIVLLGLFAGTNLYYYTLQEPLMSHVYSFAFVSAFLLVAHRQMEKFTPRGFLLLAFLLGMIVLIRPVNVLIVFALPFLAGDWATLKKFFREIFSHRFVLVAAALVCSAVVFIQLLYYHAQCGKWFVYAYGKEGFDFLHPNLLNMLFSYSNGFYLYAPLIFLFTLGIFTLYKNEKFRLAAFFVFLLPVTWVISSWWAWTYGAAFGMRPMVEYLGVFAIPGGLLVQKLSAKKWLFGILLGLVFLPLVVIEQFQIWQYERGIIAYDHMTKAMYWRVFLDSREQFMYIYRDENPVPLPNHAKPVYTYFLDYEKRDSSLDWRSVESSKAFSGKYALCLKQENNHSTWIRKSFGEMLPDSLLGKNGNWLNVKAKLLLIDNGSDGRMEMFVKRGNKWLGMRTAYFIHEVSEENKWTDFTYNFHLPPVEAGDSLIVFPRRDNWFPVYVDDLSISLYNDPAP